MGLFNFNPRSRKESDIIFCCSDKSAFKFQSTLSQGERLADIVPSFTFKPISIHALARRATFCLSRYAVRDGDFNPRSRKESDRAHFKSRYASRYFNPRSRKESDTHGHKLSAKHGHFNPRSRKESDPTEAYMSSGKFKISIHALARRATCFTRVSAFTKDYFNPRSRKESDICDTKYSTIYVNFNPRSRKESDIKFEQPHGFTFIFQSTLSQGERLGQLNLRQWPIQFQSTLSQGERLPP